MSDPREDLYQKLINHNTQGLCTLFMKKFRKDFHLEQLFCLSNNFISKSFTASIKHCISKSRKLDVVIYCSI